MYIAAIRIAAEFGCDLIGIQYQQGLKGMAPASDLVEALLNNAKRPPNSGRSCTRSCTGSRATSSWRGITPAM
jgi:hypothetical protein